VPLIIDERALALGSNYTFNTPHGKLDLLAWVEPIGDFDAVASHAETYPFHGDTVRTISLEDLIRVKEHIGRSKDRDSLIQLLAIRKAREDTGLR
jgi:predicted nucleotidyltransferase